LVAGARQDQVDGARLLLGGPISCRAARGGRCGGDGGRGDAELILERLDALGELEHADALQLLHPLLSAPFGGHYRPSSLFWSESSEVSGCWSPMPASSSVVCPASPWPAASPPGACPSEL